MTEPEPDLTKLVELAFDRMDQFREAMRASRAHEPMPDGSDPLDYVLNFPGVDRIPLRWMTYDELLAIEKWFEGIKQLAMAPFN